ncbi:glycerophosphodiester phosphodiesterase family protein [Cocleimonas sp. KMM 6892]|uniref:glycerophosphodiester phosphodiesterase family protein n=1 Tax=unclassified Cocleimonas TaxID=2639732 RepID=UPI002DC05CDD|nr:MULTISPECIES: glycerophosphodiester phosphodiesterase family protein [unclassified Cocleimonas]MEB8432727.1 glycerophosphodiester phosphodiesterase family protein [Cocleimonas sp. KMM 6892]MEC4715586.1 glycerophosphodiester phosphodiesterase family protein [Cocleimonas sp. KMM 6895]MEC4744796.1 glycerophosphodiester phosphodiesterase family protein [Cocleimonas sp. KMM 6896]
MNIKNIKLLLILTSTLMLATISLSHADDTKKAQLGPRPFFLVDNMKDGDLKKRLANCQSKSDFMRSDFSIGHRGAPMQFPEHTLESYKAAATMGAGIVECDVTFTKDKELVCRHSQCDLHTTTNILETPLASKCSVPFTPYNAETGANATAKCCASDITLAEFKTLKGKMDASNKKATTVAEYLNGTPKWRTDLYATRGTLMTHKESISLFKKLGVKMTPELKSADVKMPYMGKYSQQDYAQQMINEYKEANVSPDNVFPQSFNLEDVKYWIEKEPDFAKQAVYLDDRYDEKSFDHHSPATWSPSMDKLVADGVKIIAPPLWVLLDTDDSGKIIPSVYAKEAKTAGLKIIAWSLERSGNLSSDDGTAGGWYYQSINGTKSDKPGVIKNEGDVLTVLDVLAKDVGAIGVFSDWPATTTFYANCSAM